MVKLSKRMKAVSSMVTAGYRLADVGTDHGYVPIALVQKGKIPSAVAMDINAGPLERAEEHIREQKLEGQISTRLCDGLTGLNPGDVDSVLVAGMGGELMLHILSEGEAVCREAKELILQPQSDIRKVRKYLRQHNYRIVDEDMVLEDGKYYPMMRAVPVEDTSNWNRLEPWVVTACDIYGPLLLKNGHPVLRKYLVREHKMLMGILKGLDTKEPTEKVVQRRQEIDDMLAYNESAYTILGDIVHAGI